VLDATATSDQLGKTAGKDAAHAKATFCDAVGRRRGRAEAEKTGGAGGKTILRDAGLVSPMLVSSPTNRDEA